MLYAVKTPEGYVNNRPNGHEYAFSRRLNDARIFNKKNAATIVRQYVVRESQSLREKPWKYSEVEVVEVGAIKLE